MDKNVPCKHCGMLEDTHDRWKKGVLNVTAEVANKPFFSYEYSLAKCPNYEPFKEEEVPKDCQRC